MAWGGDRRSPKAHVNHVGNPLWEYRVMRKLSQAQLANEMFVSQRSISDMERGRLPLNDYTKNWLTARGVTVSGMTISE